MIKEIDVLVKLSICYNGCSKAIITHYDAGDLRSITYRNINSNVQIAMEKVLTDMNDETRYTYLSR